MKKNSKKVSKKQPQLVATPINPLEAPCPRCGALPRMVCTHTETGEKLKKFHNARVTLAETAAAATSAVKHVIESKKPKVPEYKPTDEQAEVIETITDKFMAIHHREIQFVGPVVVGPVVSAYKFMLPKQVKLSAMEGMAADFGMALGTDSIMVKRMPGDTAVSVWIPNKERKYIQYRDTVTKVWQMVKSNEGNPGTMPIPLNFGVDHLGNQFIEDLTKTTHLLVAGSTGSGKSTLIRSIVATLAYTMDPKMLKLVISDMKGIEFPRFAELPHLLYPIATTWGDTVEAMEGLCEEVKRRKEILRKSLVENLQKYNTIHKDNPLPYIVMVIDELANLTLYKGEKRSEAKLAEAKLQVITSEARALGVYVIAGTQRPSVDVVKGLVKTNFPARISFRLPSALDSRTVIVSKGAEQLMAQGDMLYYSPRQTGLIRLHAPMANDDDITMAVQAAKTMYPVEAPTKGGIQMPPSSIQ